MVYSLASILLNAKVEIRGVLKEPVKCWVQRWSFEEIMQRDLLWAIEELRYKLPHISS